MKHYKKNESIVDFYFWSENKWCLFLSGNTQVFFYYQVGYNNYISCGNIPFSEANGYYDSNSNSIIWTIDTEIKGYFLTHKAKKKKGISRYMLRNMKYLIKKYDYNVDKMINEFKEHIPLNATKGMSFASKYQTYHL